MLDVQPEQVLAELGGVASRAELLAHVSDWALRRALTDGRIVRLSRGWYALPDAPRFGERVEQAELAQAARRAARSLSGTAILLSAAARWGWPTKWVATRPQVAVPLGRKVGPTRRRSVDVRWRAVPPGDVEDGWVTTRVRTALDCASLLPGDEALAVLDSALREGMVGRDELLMAAAALPTLHRRRAESRIRLARPDSANPFESVLRWIIADIPGLNVDTQVRIGDVDGLIGVVDLADARLKIVLEADSFEWHGNREALERDCIRYDRLVAEGGLVLRFSWDRVMNHPEWVRDVVVRTVALRDSRV
jgi:very-short-patch-repair endonuclease